MPNPRSKGKNGEYEVRDLLNNFFRKHMKGGQRIERMPMSGAIKGMKGDLKDLPEFLRKYLFEIKRVENLALPMAIKQAYREAGVYYPAETGKKVPLVVHRRSTSKDGGKESWPLQFWHVTMPLSHLLSLILELHELSLTSEAGRANKEKK